MNGDPLPPEHGYPARLLSPGRYGTKNPKWVTEIRLVDEPFLGFWEERSWSNDASYLPNAFIRDPRDNDEVRAPIVVLGTAFAGSDEIARVEISTDGGATWTDAELTYQNGPDIWTLWRFDWDDAEPGDYDVRMRVTTVSGAMSSEDPDGTNFLNGYDGGMEISVRVKA
jgi:hypothetical protein